MNKPVNNIYYKSDEIRNKVDRLRESIEKILNRPISINDIRFSNTNGISSNIDIDEPIYVDENDIAINEKDVFYLKLNGVTPFMSKLKIRGDKIELVTTIKPVNKLILRKNEVKIIGKVLTI